MSKWVVDIHGDIEGDYEIIKKYEESKTDVLDKIKAEIEQMDFDFGDFYDHTSTIREMVLEAIDKHRAESEE